MVQSRIGSQYRSYPSPRVSGWGGDGEPTNTASSIVEPELEEPTLVFQRRGI
jgi:hypothetical protein